VIGDIGMEETKFFPTEALKRAKELKPITSYIPEDGRDPNPMWDDVARSLWPAAKENQTDREALAEVLMWASYDDTVLGAAPTAGIMMSRMAQRLMGNEWMKRWAWENQHPLRRRISINKREFGGMKKTFKNFFSSL
jgi:hypothetical protein